MVKEKSNIFNFDNNYTIIILEKFIEIEKKKIYKKATILILNI